MAVVDTSTTYFDWDKTKCNRDVTTKDLWLAIVWPLLSVKFVFFAVLILIHETFRVLCLLLGFNYKNTTCYERTNNLIYAVIGK